MLILLTIVVSNIFLNALKTKETFYCMTLCLLLLLDLMQFSSQHVSNIRFLIIYFINVNLIQWLSPMIYNYLSLIIPTIINAKKVFA